MMTQKGVGFGHAAGQKRNMRRISSTQVVITKEGKLSLSIGRNATLEIQERYGGL